MKIKRSILNELSAQFSEPRISVLVGPRQVGKTFLLRQLQEEAGRRGLSSRYFNLELPEDMLAMGRNDADQFNALLSAGDVVFVDEFHLIKNMSHVFKALFDSGKNIKVFASSSSALELHAHLKESMAGRVIFNRITPLSLAEQRQQPGFVDDQALVMGGLPGLVNLGSNAEKMRELQTIVATYIARDIKGLIREENIRAFNQLLYLLAERQGALAVSANIAAEIGVSKPTVEKYLDVMAQTYVCHSLYSYARNLGNELKKSRKHYLFDVGIRNSLLRDFRQPSERPDAGILRESFVALSLFRQLQPNMELRFWRTKRGQEVDFIVLNNRVPTPIEVKSRLHTPDLPEGIRAFLNAYPDAPRAIVFNDGLDDEITHAGRPVRFLPWTQADDINVFT